MKMPTFPYISLHFPGLRFPYDFYAKSSPKHDAICCNLSIFSYIPLPQKSKKGAKSCREM